TTVGLRHAIHLGAVVRKGALLEAELLLAALTTRTFATRIDKASDAGNVANLEFGDRIADLRNSAHDLVSGHERIIRRHRILPFILRLVNIGVANAREQNVDQDVVRADIASLKIEWCKISSRLVNRITFCFDHIFSLASF